VVQVAGLLDQREPSIEAVVICRMDRLGRDASETLGYLHRFASGKIGLVSILDRLDLSTSQGRAMAGVAAVFGQLERELIGQRTSEALARLRDEGKVYGAVPYGFRRRGDRLVADEDEQRVVRQIVELRESRCSFREIAAWLNGQQHRPPDVFAEEEVEVIAGAPGGAGWDSEVDQCPLGPTDDSSAQLSPCDAHSS
jgi:DNA invertase Pin-like site-specific DNA recombinase